MAIPPTPPLPVQPKRILAFGKTRIIGLVALVALLIVTLVFAWTSRGALENLATLRQRNATGAAGAAGPKTLVDLSPWQTAQTLAALAVTAEELEFAHDAERLADHEVDQAFASALRQARLKAEHRTLTGEARALAQRVADLQQLVAQDQAQVDTLSSGSGPSSSAGGKNAAPAAATSDNSDLEVAKAQLGLDSDELADAQEDLQRASGDTTVQIQEELNAHEASMKQYDQAVQSGAQIAVVSEKRHGTLAGRIRAWFNQIDRHNSILQAQQQAQDDVRKLTANHNALESAADASPGSAANAADRAAKVADLKDRAAQRQILSIYDDRIQTEQQLASVYGKWAAQVQLQHRIVFHLILQSVALIIFILVCMLLSDALVRRVMAHPALDRRQMQTLRSILQVGVQVIGIVLILLVIFGMPQETPTILGLATAALTIALQDFIIAFLGWFFLVGKNGMRVGDWVEINGVGGIVTEVGLFYSTLLETGTTEDKGHPTGRRITFMNGFAIRGQYFNFSTTGQWMWDEMSVNIPSTEDVHLVVDRLQKAVGEETQENSRLAEMEWKRGTHGYGLSRFAATPVVTLRPSGSGLDAQVRYVTRASERFELRNRLYQRFIDVLQSKPEPAEETRGVASA